MSARGRPDREDYFIVGLVSLIAVLFWLSFAYQRCPTDGAACVLNGIEKWQTLITGVLALAAALLGSWILVRTTRQQVDNQNRIARREADDTYKAVLVRTKSLLESVNTFWRALELAIRNSNNGILNHLGLIGTTQFVLPKTQDIDRLQEASLRLMPTEVLRWTEIILALRWVERECNATDYRTIDMNKARLMTIIMSHLARAAGKADSELRAVFINRLVEETNDSPASAHVNNFLDKWERDHSGAETEAHQ